MRRNRAEMTWMFLTALTASTWACGDSKDPFDRESCVGAPVEQSFVAKRIPSLNGVADRNCIKVGEFNTELRFRTCAINSGRCSPWAEASIEETLSYEHYALKKEMLRGNIAACNNEGPSLQFFGGVKSGEDLSAEPVGISRGYGLRGGWYLRGAYQFPILGSYSPASFFYLDYSDVPKETKEISLPSVRGLIFSDITITEECLRMEKTWNALADSSRRQVKTYQMVMHGKLDFSTEQP